MKSRFIGVFLAVMLFSMIAVIPRGFSQLNIEFNYLVDEYNGTFEVNLTAPAYITSIPILVQDADGDTVLEREIGQHFTKRIEKARFNRFILNMALPERMPVKVVLFPQTALQRGYTLEAPRVNIDLRNKKAMVYLNRNSSYLLAVKNGELGAEYSVFADEDGWHQVDMGDMDPRLLSPGTGFYSTIAFPGGLNTTVARYVPVLAVDAGSGYTSIKGSGISGEIPRIDVLNGNGIYKTPVREIADFKEGRFIFQDSFQENNREVRDGDSIVYKEKGHSFRFDIPDFRATYNLKDNSITGTVSRSGKVVFRYGSRLLEATPDKRGRFKIMLQEEGDTIKLLNVKGGYISPSGNQYWKKFDWSHLFKASPLYSASQTDLRVMSYNIHHGISMDGKLDIDAIVEVIRESGAQIIGLQEVDRSFIRTAFRDQTRQLAQQLGMHYYFAETFNILGAEYGNAILSTFPITGASNLQLDSRGEQRGIVSARIDVNGKEINFLVTHLSLNKSVREVQVQQMKRYIELLDNEVVLVGDFNSAPESEEVMYIERVLKEAGKDAGKDELYTFQNRDGSGARIDYVFLSPQITVGDVYTIESRASDHLPLVADIRINDM